MTTLKDIQHTLELYSSSVPELKGLEFVAGDDRLGDIYALTRGGLGLVGMALIIITQHIL